MNLPPSTCPYHVTSWKECQDKSVTVEWLNGRPDPQGGLWEWATHECVRRINCCCNYYIWNAFRSLYD